MTYTQRLSPPDATGYEPSPQDAYYAAKNSLQRAVISLDDLCQIEWEEGMVIFAHWSDSGIALTSGELDSIDYPMSDDEPVIERHIPGSALEEIFENMEAQ